MKDLRYATAEVHIHSVKEFRSVKGQQVTYLRKIIEEIRVIHIPDHHSCPEAYEK